jgi:hypothetical protein
MIEQWEARFKKCGNFYYGCLNCSLETPIRPVCGPWERTILAVKTSPESWEIQEYERSEADKANEIAWYADITIKADMSSSCDLQTGQWTQFNDGMLAFWNFCYFAGGNDIPWIFQVVRYNNGKYNLFFSNQYKNNINAGSYGHLSQAWLQGLRPANCDEVPAR